MAWYNPLDWFRKIENQAEEKSILYCDNPQCQGIIEGNKITYDKEHREIYHVGECGIFATAHRASKSCECEVQNVDYISRDKALKLLRNGKLEQSRGLEERASMLSE